MVVGGVGWGGNTQMEGRPRSLLGQVRADGEAGRPERRHAEDRLDGGPGAAEDGVALPVVQLHKGVLGGRGRHEEEADA